MDIRQHIIAIAGRQRTFTVNDVLRAMRGKYTRAYVLRFVGDLLHEGKIMKSGSTRGAVYALSAKAGHLSNRFHKRYVNKGLREDEIWMEVRGRCPFIARLPRNVENIFTHAFTEMLNNAIEHSRSRYVMVKVEKRGGTARFIIDDYGIGAWSNIMNKRKLSSELEAVQDLLKGKLTTAPRHHSGEGIFFTSKAADMFTLSSGTTEMKIDNTVRDTFISDLKPRKNGTRVAFEIGEKHRGTLDEVFRKYYTSQKDFAFDKTEIAVKLYTLGTQHVSRSQARRILAGLEKFKTVILDFDRVSGVGQAFADEIFRVFVARHRTIRIIPKNMNEAVKFMVVRVERPGKAR